MGTQNRYDVLVFPRHRVIQCRPRVSISCIYIRSGFKQNPGYFAIIILLGGIHNQRRGAKRHCLRCLVRFLAIRIRRVDFESVE